MLRGARFGGPPLAAPDPYTSESLPMTTSFLKRVAALSALALTVAGPALAGEADLKLPDLAQATFLGGIDGKSLLSIGMLICFGGLGFGLFMYQRVKNLPVHESMLEISELIYETCKTYLLTQGKFILVLQALIGVIMVAYFGWINPLASGIPGVGLVLLFSLIG